MAFERRGVGCHGIQWGGRWNSPGHACVYTSGTLALAVLELAVHPILIPKAPYICFSVEIPGSVRMEAISPEDLPANWRDYPAPPGLTTIGDSWLKRNETAALVVPSAVMPAETNYLLNPAHPAFEQLTISDARPFEFDPRLFEPSRRR